MGVYCYDCDKKHNRHDNIISQSNVYRLLDGLKLGSGLLLNIVVNCCVACRARRAAMCVGYMKCLLSLTCSV